MEFLSGWGGLLVLALVLVFVILAITTVFGRNYVKVPKNKVAVFTGRGEAKIINGGARFRMPLLEQVNICRSSRSTSRRRSSTCTRRTTSR